MLKHTCFLIHGMGSHGEGWSKKAVTALGEAAVHHNIINAAEEINEKVEFVEIRYNEIFEGVVKNWNTLASSLSDMPASIQPEVSKIASWIAEHTNGDAGFVTTHALDVAMYFSFNIISRMVQLEVASQMMAIMAAHAEDENHKNIVIAHSLGTAVANDAIHRLATTKWLSNTNKREAIAKRARTLGSTLTADELNEYKLVFRDVFGPGQSCFEAIYMIANVSPILQKVNVKPSKGFCAPRYADLNNPDRWQGERFINIGHVIDPVHVIGNFQAENAWPFAAARGTTYDISVRHFWDEDIHSLEHYFMHPKVYRDILPAIMHVGNVSKFYKEAGNRLEGLNPSFPEIGPKYQDKPDEIKQIQTELSEFSKKIPQTIKNKFNKIVGYYNWAQEKYDSYKNL